MRVELIATGTELAVGLTCNTNHQYLAERLTGLGASVNWQTTVPDGEVLIAEAVRIAAGRCDVVVVTGGLGPTRDDLTRQAVAMACGVELRLDHDALERLERLFAARGYALGENNKLQAYVPEGGELLSNDLGTAPGFHVQHAGADIYVLPGVPSEMKRMFERHVAPQLACRGGAEGRGAFTKTLWVYGVPESQLDRRIGHLIQPDSNPVVGLTVSRGVVGVRITARAETPEKAASTAEATAAEVRALLGLDVFGEGTDTLEEVVAAMLITSGRTLAVAESCTGGLITSLLTDVSGISAVLLEGVVAYSNEAKVNRLSVARETLASHGAVSAEVAGQMAEGIRRAAGSDYGIATTGIAGPTGGTSEKPVGLVYTALASEDGMEVKQHQFLGLRGDVKDRAAKSALNMLRLKLLEASPS